MYGSVRTESDEIEEAARYVVNAASGLDHVAPRNTKAAKAAYGLSKRLKVIVQDGVVPLLLILTFFERPRWCQKLEECTCRYKVDEGCDRPTFDVRYLSTAAKLSLESCLFCVVAAHQLCSRIALGGRFYWHDDFKYQLVALFTAICANAVFGAAQTIRNSKLETIAFFVASYVRLGIFISYSSDVRSQLRLAGHILPHFLRVGSLIALMTFFYAWFGVVMFPATSTEGREYFPNLRDAAWQLLILITTANFPDIGLPAFLTNRWSMLFFASFVIVGCFFLMNLLLATVYNVYTEERGKFEQRAKARADDNLNLAFEVLAGNGGDIPVETMHCLFDELNRHHEVTYIDAERAIFLVGELDQSSDNRIDRQEFDALCSVLRLESRDEKMRLDGPPGPVASFVRGRPFEYLIDGLLVVNALVIAWQTKDALQGTTASETSAEESSSSIWEGVETMFAGIYLLEMVFKIWAIPDYWYQGRHQFDAAVTLASVLSVIIVAFTSVNTVLRYVLMVRLLRLVRLLAAIPEFRVIGSAKIKFQCRSFVGRNSLFSDSRVVRSRSCDHSCRDKKILENFWIFLHFYLFILF